MLQNFIEFYNKALNQYKVTLEETLSKFFMSDFWNEFSRILANYGFDLKELTDKNMEKMLSFLRISSKSDMEEIGEDIADLKRNIKALKEQIKELSEKKYN